jgi:hypothetical protein
VNRAVCCWLVALALTLLGACGHETANPRPATQAAPTAETGPVGFIVRFEEPHPLARAQALQAADRCDEAAELARDTLTARSELAGLCFDRFTLGGAEIVLTACEQPADPEQFASVWLQRLRAMNGVVYADVNASARAAECVG